MKLKQLIKPLFLLGVLMCGFAAVKLAALPGYTQYAFRLSGTQAEAAKALEGAEDGISGGLTGVKYSQNIGGVSGVTVFMPGPGAPGICPIPIAQGDGFGRMSLETSEKSCIPDENLAFQLFGNADPIGQTLEIGGQTFTVRGTARFTRTAGDTDGYALWIPFGSCSELAPDIAVLVSDSLDEKAAQGLFPGGTYIDLDKEVMRAFILPGFACAALVLALVRAAVSLWNKALKNYAQAVRKRAGIMYAGRNTLYSLPGGAALAVSAVLGIALCALLLSFFAQPVYVFTEWIPDDLVSMDSIISRIRELCAAAARPARYITREYALIRFYAGLMRWGTLCMLLSCARTWIRNRIR